MINDSEIFPHENVSSLNSRYPESEYMPLENSPKWISQLGDISRHNFGIQILLCTSGVKLNYLKGDSKIKPEPISVYLASLVSRARFNKSKISIGLPPFGRDLSLFFACISVLNKVIERGIKNESSNRGILIVSVDLRVRSLYCELFVKNEPLDNAFPGSRLLPTGGIQPLGKSVHKIFSGVSFFLPYCRELPRRLSIQPDLIILDLRYGRLNSKVQSLVNWAQNIRPTAGVIALYSIGDRISRAALRDANFKDFPLDHSAIKNCKKFVKKHKNNLASTVVDLNLYPATEALSRKHILKSITAPSEIKTTIANLLKLFIEHNQNQHLELNRLRWLFSVYSQMPVPLVWYENVARGRGRWIPNSVIKRIGTVTRDIGKLGPVLQTFRANFKHLNSLFEKSNPKAEEIKKIILSLSGELSDKKKMLIIVRDEAMENALSSWLTLSEFMGKIWLEYIDIISCRKYMQYADKRYSYFISTGPIHYKYRWILGGDIGRELHFILYPHEIDIVKNQITQFYDQELLNLRSERRQKMFGFSNSEKSNKESLEYPELNISIMGDSSSTTPKVRQKFKEKIKSFDDLMDKFKEQEEKQVQKKEEAAIDTDSVCEDLLEEEEIDEDVTDYTREEINSYTHDVDGLKCYEITAQSKTRGRGKIWINENSHVEFIRPSNSMELFRMSPDNLEVNDLMLRVDENQQTGIFERLIEIADSSPRIQYIVVFRDIWRRAINLLIVKFQNDIGEIDYYSMFKALKKEGFRITTIQTLKNWINDIVIGPEDIYSIIAVGNVSGVLEMSKNAKQFDKTFEQIRALHRSIGRKVASIIRKMFKIVVNDEGVDSNIQIDDYLGIPLTEVINAIEIVKILEIIPPSKEGVAPNIVGKFINIK